MQTEFYGDVDFIIDLMLQRTDFLIREGHGSAITHWTQTGDIDPLRKLASDTEFTTQFFQYTLDSIETDASNIAKVVSRLKPSIESIASIGCGNGIAELHLIKLLSPKIIYLIDIETTPDRHYHGVASEGAGYCSLSRTVKFLEDNLSRPPIIVPINPTKQDLPLLRLDLLISLLSAGFHYPISSYTNFISGSLAINGLLIFDQRINAGNEFAFSLASLVHKETVISHPKYNRKVFVKNSGFPIDYQIKSSALFSRLRQWRRNQFKPTHAN